MMVSVCHRALVLVAPPGKLPKYLCGECGCMLHDDEIEVVEPAGKVWKEFE